MIIEQLRDRLSDFLKNKDVVIVRSIAIAGLVATVVTPVVRWLYGATH